MTRLGKKAEGPGYITNKDNPLTRVMTPPNPVFSYNMDVLHRDVDRREQPTHGAVYSGIMDNMRYRGNE